MPNLFLRRSPGTVSVKGLLGLLMKAGANLDKTPSKAPKVSLWETPSENQVQGYGSFFEGMPTIFSAVSGIV